MLEQNTAQSGSGIKKVIAIEGTLVALLFMASVAIRHMSVIFSDLLSVIAIVVMSAIPFTYGIFWDKGWLSRRTRAFLIGGATFIAISYIGVIAEQVIYEHAPVSSYMVEAAWTFAAIYIPFFIGRGVRLLLSRRR